MAWCHQATSHYLSQCWPRSLSPYDVTRTEWVNLLWFFYFYRKCYHFVAESKWPTFCRQYFQMHFLSIKKFEFWLKFHWSLFPWIQLTKRHHWSDNGMTPMRRQAYYLNQWLLNLLTHLCVTWPQWVIGPQCTSTGQMCNEDHQQCLLSLVVKQGTINLLSGQGIYKSTLQTMQYQGRSPFWKVNRAWNCMLKPYSIRMYQNQV